MFGDARKFTFHGKSLVDRGYDVITNNYEDYYNELRKRGFVPIIGTEDIEVVTDDGVTISWELSIIGKECDRQYDVRWVTQEGDIEWFSTPEDTSEAYLKV